MSVTIRTDMTVDEAKRRAANALYQVYPPVDAGRHPLYAQAIERVAGAIRAAYRGGRLDEKESA